MKVGKHTLLIDGNYFVFSRLFVLPKPKNGQKLLGDDKQKSQFMRKLSIDFASEMRKLKMFVDDVVLTVDSKSWRKDLYPDSEYKGTRKQSSNVDWTAVYGVYEEFQKILLYYFRNICNATRQLYLNCNILLHRTLHVHLYPSLQLNQAISDEK